MQLQQIVLSILLVFTLTFALVCTQSYPPRLNIPGAGPVPAARSSPLRNDKLVRVRRPIALRTPQNAIIPSITPRIIEDAKPVTESAEDEVPDAFLPTLLREQQLAQAQQAQFHHAAAAFFNNEPNSIQETPISHLLHQDELSTATLPTLLTTATRFPERTLPPRPQFNDYGIGAGFGGGGSGGSGGNSIGSQRFGLERVTPQSQPTQFATASPSQNPPSQLPQRTNIIRTRPSAREPRPSFESASSIAPAPPPQPTHARPRPKPIQARPIIEQNQLQDERDNQQPRRQRPVAQTLRKWREENEDGSITWGYENDDGSFKEEIIGTDCITKGTYGYVDPDGNKREYHYETGIKCDPNTRETEEELQENGFINYEENKAVLPNGIEIDMSQLGKKKSKRPNANYRN